MPSGAVHPALRNHRDRQRKLALQKPCLSQLKHRHPYPAACPGGCTGTSHARRSVAREGTSRRALPWLAATIGLGLVFLAGQWTAWQQLAMQGVFFRSSQSSHFFYLITGVHAFHLFLGIAALIAAFVGLYVSRQLENRQIIVDCAGWYWHAMGLLWIFLFVLLVFFQ